MVIISEPSVKGIFTRVIKSQLRNHLVSGNRAFYLFYEGYDPYMGRHEWAVDYSERGYMRANDVQCLPEAKVFTSSTLTT